MEVTSSGKCSLADYAGSVLVLYLELHLLLKVLLEPADLLLQAGDASAEERDGGGTRVLAALWPVSPATPAQADGRTSEDALNRSLLTPRSRHSSSVCLFRVNSHADHIHGNNNSRIIRHESV